MSIRGPGKFKAGDRVMAAIGNYAQREGIVVEADGPAPFRYVVHFGTSASVFSDDQLVPVAEQSEHSAIRYWYERSGENYRALKDCQDQRRRLIARQSTIRAAIERLQREASGDDSDYGMGILHAVSTILAAVQDLEDGATPAPSEGGQNQ